MEIEHTFKVKRIKIANKPHINVWYKTQLLPLS